MKLVKDFIIGFANLIIMAILVLAFISGGIIFGLNFFFFIIILSIIILIINEIIKFYNKYTVLKLRVENANSQIAASIKKIQTKIKNLEKVFEKTTDKESEIWKLFAEARKINPESPQDQEKFNQLFKNMIISIEQYPELKAIPEIGKLFYEDISEMYDEYIEAIKNYNDVVFEHNVFIKQFPNLIYAKLFRIKKIKMFETTDLEDIKKIKTENMNL